MKFSLLQEMRNNVMQPAQMVGIETDGKTTREVAEETALRILQQRAKLEDAQAQLRAWQDTARGVVRGGE